MEAKHAKLWKAKYTPSTAWIPDRQAMDRPTPDMIRAASRTFSTRTSSSLDGFHPTHLQHFSDDALEALCDLFVACEALGLFPAQLTWMVMPMLPKAAGGHRLIILYSMAYRVWQRMRKYALKPISDRLRRPFWGAAVGRSATDSAWILAADAEQNVSNGRHTATVIADYSKYYETIPLDEARDKLLRLGMPSAMVKVTYNQWKGPRIIRLRQHHGSRPAYADYGLPAGDGYADVVIEAHAMELYDQYVDLHPLVRFSSYIDDTAIGVNGHTHDSVITQAVKAGKDFFVTAADLGAQLNDKLVVVASSTSISKAIVQQLGLAKTTNQRRATYLGVDYSSGRRRLALRTRNKLQ